jgi:pyrroline-5-carboxylate reductase
MPPLQSCKIAFIGGGNMATAIIRGLSTTVPLSHLTVSEPLDAARTKLRALGVHTTNSNADATAEVDLVVVAVKPQVARTVCTELASAWATRSKLPTVLSIAAGITLASLSDWLRLPGGRSPHIVRAMPNTPALVGEGATGVFAGPDVTADEKELVGALMDSISHATEWVASEPMLDVVTGLSGRPSEVDAEEWNFKSNPQQDLGLHTSSSWWST